MSEHVNLPSLDAPVVLEADVVVCGAGSAGLGAALAAARRGAKVALVERWPFFGGNATAASLGSICGLYVRTNDTFDHLSNGIAREWAQGLAASGWGLGPIPYKETAVMPYVPWGYKRLADRLISEEERITPLLHAFISGVVRSGDAIEAVVVATKQGPKAVRGKVFVDATGDADIVYHAGCPWEMGEPGRLQYPSMQFYMQNVDLAEAMKAGLGLLAEKIRTAYESRSHDLTRAAGAVIPTMREGEIVGAMTRVAKASGAPPDGTDVFELTEAEMKGRAIAEESARFLVDEMPGFASAYLQDTAVTVGIRETRHAIGDHVLSFDEAMNCTKFSDGVAASAWPFEFHTQGAETRWEFLPDGDWFEIPLRSLIARDVSNVLVAGRCMSATHEALASSRVTGTCMAIGEAAGSAAAMCIAEQRMPREIDGEKLRAELVAGGALSGP
ncbi:MAG: FAD-dependent oxidoreductase [Actinomycetota bacterium]